MLIILHFGTFMACPPPELIEREPQISKASLMEKAIRCEVQLRLILPEDLTPPLGLTHTYKKLESLPIVLGVVIGVTEEILWRGVCAR